MRRCAAARRACGSARIDSARRALQQLVEVARVRSTSRSLARAARTDAERGESVSSASSPSASPRPSSRITASAVVVDDLQPPGPHDVHRLAGVAFAEQPVAGAQTHRCARAARAPRAAAGSRLANSGTRARKSAADCARAGGAAPSDRDRAARARTGAPAAQHPAPAPAHQPRAASPSDGASASTTRPTSRQPIAGGEQAGGAELPRIVETRRAPAAARACR